jgi:lysophosphatidate acyltransferase
VLAKLWPVIGRATQVAKKEVFYLFPFGLACYLWGTLFINRQNKAAARNAINRESKAINEIKVKFDCDGN